jgi:hypothetical protein
MRKDYLNLDFEREINRGRILEDISVGMTIAIIILLVFAPIYVGYAIGHLLWIW